MVLGLVNTPKFWKTFDDLLSNVMDATTIELCKQFNPKWLILNQMKLVLFLRI
jgi:hypothetical protein